MTYKNVKSLQYSVDNTTSKLSLPVIDWMFGSSSWFVRLQQCTKTNLILCDQL